MFVKSFVIHGIVLAISIKCTVVSSRWVTVVLSALLSCWVMFVFFFTSHSYQKFVWRLRVCCFVHTNFRSWSVGLFVKPIVVATANCSHCFHFFRFCLCFIWVSFCPHKVLFCFWVLVSSALRWWLQLFSFSFFLLLCPKTLCGIASISYKWPWKETYLSASTTTYMPRLKYCSNV